MTLIQGGSQFGIRHAAEGLRQILETGKLIIIDISPVLLGKQIGKDPVPPVLFQNDRTVRVLVQPLLEHTPAKIISLPLHDLTNRRNQHRITDACIPCCLAEPGCLEGLRQRFS